MVSLTVVHSRRSTGWLRYMLGVSNSDLEGNYLMGTEQYLMYLVCFGRFWCCMYAVGVCIMITWLPQYPLGAEVAHCQPGGSLNHQNHRTLEL